MVLLWFYNSSSLHHYKLHILSVMRYRGPEESQVALEERYLLTFLTSLCVFLRAYHNVAGAVKGCFTEFHHTRSQAANMRGERELSLECE